MSSTQHLPELESLRSQVAGLARELAERDQAMQTRQQGVDGELQDLRKQSDFLRAIMEGTAADTGDDFFASLAIHLTSTLHMQYAVIGEVLEKTPVSIRTLAVSSRGTLLENFEYDLAAAPCRTGLTEPFRCFEQSVQALFQNFPPLATMGVESHSGVSIRNKQGKVVGLIVVIDTQPIAHQDRLQTLLQVFAPRAAAELQRAQTETTLQEQTRQLAHAQSLAHLGSWDWDINTGETAWSEEQFRIFGHEPGAIAITYDTFLAALLPADHDRVLAAVNDALLGKCPLDLECRIVRPNGNIRVIHMRAEVQRDATAHPIRMAGTALDITEHTQTEEALRASEERWHLAMQGSNDGIWAWNIQAGEIFFSERWKAMRGFADHEIRNHIDEWRSRIHPDDLDRVLRSIDHYLAKQTSAFCEKYRVQCKDGSYIWLLDRGVALWAENGTPLRMAGSETDITEQKRTEEALQQREQDLRDAMNEREQISQDLHDGILQSLYAIGLGLESCKSLIKQRSNKKVTNLLDQAVSQMNHLMGEVRNFITGLDSDILQDGKFSIALHAMIQMLVVNHPMRCHLTIDETAVRHLSTKQTFHMMNIIHEAVSNSLRHGHATTATVSLKPLAHSIRLTICDNGKGFEPADAHGLGHGLSNMCARAKKMGGHFSIQSTREHGTCITIDVPKETCHAESDRAHGSSAARR